VYIFFDIDGTLRSRKDYKIPQSTYDAIKALKKKGYILGIATGRGLYSARMFAQELGMNFVISDGGRCVLYDDKIIYKNYIPKDVVNKVTEFAKGHQIPIGYSNHYAIHSESDVFSKSFSLDQTILCSVKENIDVELLFGLTKLYLWGDKEVIESDPFVSSLEHHWLRETLCVIEHMHKDEGILVLEKMFNLNRDEMVAFGDDVNDITMFEHCKTAVCMGNGNDETKAHATYIANHIDEDGILKACLDLNLISKEDI